RAGNSRDSRWPREGGAAVFEHGHTGDDAGRASETVDSGVLGKNAQDSSDHSRNAPLGLGFALCRADFDAARISDLGGATRHTAGTSGSARVTGQLHRAVDGEWADSHGAAGGEDGPAGENAGCGIATDVQRGNAAGVDGEQQLRVGDSGKIDS